MPLNGRDAAVLCVLVFCVPLQHWLTQMSVVSPTERNMELFKFIHELKHYYDTHFTLTSWREWIINMSKSFIIGTKDYSMWYNMDINDPEGVCPAVEVLNLRNPEGTFGLSPKPRSTRPLGLKLRIGQVVRHNRWNYHGVIIGWDTKCKAPEQWIKQMHRDHEEWRNQPNYAVLVDTNDRDEPQITYVPQENIHPVKNTKINHPDLPEYFSSFDGAQYIPHKWLRAIYPLD
ncbi:uncharacterized protein [Palaemon carinicauda]|uniref:uncharacterized protein n=1 Tax=Palaemon carinicauda TaxID=392227 RepID=UPI0035B5CFF2